MKRLIVVFLFLVALLSGTLWGASEIRVYNEEAARKEAVAREVEGLRRQAESGDVASQIAFAGRLRAGDGVERDPAAAVEWYRQAARRGSTVAASALGEMYENGAGVPQDYLRAADWYRVAVSFGGPAGAYYALGRMHLYGRGVVHDPLEAFTYVRRAADLGDGSAQHLLAMMYEEGWGTEVDRVEAYTWSILASQRPVRPDVTVRADPDTVRTRLAARLNSQQIREAEKRARAWAPKR